MAYKIRQRKPTSSKNSTESDIITFLDKYFIDFEDNLRVNNFDKINTSLVENIIDKYSKIFQLWDENRILQASIGKKKLENVYKSMHNVFNSDFDRIYEPAAANDFTLECNHCGEAFPLRNGDCQYSFNVHALSQDHIQFIRNLNIQHDENMSSTSSHNDAIINDVLLKVEKIVAKHDNLDESITSRLARLNVLNDEPKIVDKPAPVNTCKSGFESIIIRRQHGWAASASSRLTTASKNRNTNANHQVPSTLIVENNKLKVEAKPKPAPTTVPQKSAKNHPKNSVISEFDVKCIIFDKNALHCKICGVKLAPKHNIMPHMKGKMHKNHIKAFAYEHNAPCLDFMRAIDGEIQCNICDDYTCKKASKFVAHCESSGHLEKIKKTGMQLSVFAVERSRIAKVILCPIPKCSASLTKFELLMEHLQSVHKIK